MRPSILLIELPLQQNLKHIINTVKKLLTAVGLIVLKPLSSKSDTEVTHLKTKKKKKCTNAKAVTSDLISPK